MAEKIAETRIAGGQAVKPGLVIPKGIDPERFIQASQAKAVIRMEYTEGGSITVNCPYCILYYRTKNAIDITRFIDGDGNREHTTACSKGHTVKFKSIPQWREERQKMGLQVRN